MKHLKIATAGLIDSKFEQIYTASLLKAKQLALILLLQLADRDRVKRTNSWRWLWSETGLYCWRNWKRQPRRAYISKTEKSALGFKAVKGYSKNLFSVQWQANKKSWMTSSLFQNWVLTCAIPEIKAYCNKENFNFKALVIVDNAPATQFMLTSCHKAWNLYFCCLIRQRLFSRWIDF